MKFDLSQFELKETSTLDVELPNGDPMLVDGKQVQIELYGKGSKEYTSAKHKLDRAVQEKSFAMLRGKVNKNPEENDKIKNEFLVAVTKEIHNLPVTAIEIYGNPKLCYITEQVEKHLDETANFM